MTPSKERILIGIAGGTGSGKTTAARNILDGIGSEDVCILKQDSYYYDLSTHQQENLHLHNFDHPDAIEWDLLVSHLKTLLDGGVIQQQVYDYKTHARTDDYITLGPHSVIVLEGILILSHNELRNLMDIKIYVDTADDIRLMRRLKRDVQERARTMEMVLAQYEKTVRPMHLQFVEPSKRYADVIIPEGGNKLVAIDLLQTKIRQLLMERDLQ
ncbi:MAG: uridine kinase [bacterium]